MLTALTLQALRLELLCEDEEEEEDNNDTLSRQLELNMALYTLGKQSNMELLFRPEGALTLVSA